ncbi:MAG: hypothetical protein ACI8UO_004364 [Verrucomicrobiales bacterium]|jgi:hypothetical protein
MPTTEKTETTHWLDHLSKPHVQKRLLLFAVIISFGLWLVVPLIVNLNVLESHEKDDTDKVLTAEWIAQGDQFIRHVEPAESEATIRYTRKGQRGDSFGSVNSLFAGLAAGLFFAALLLQMSEFRQQRLQFEELTIANEDSSDTLDRQVRLDHLRERISVETTLIQSLSDIVQDTGFGPNDGMGHFATKILKSLGKDTRNSNNLKPLAQEALETHFKQLLKLREELANFELVRKPVQ